MNRLTSIYYVQKKVIPLAYKRNERDEEMISGWILVDLLSTQIGAHFISLNSSEEILQPKLK